MWLPVIIVTAVLVLAVMAAAGRMHWVGPAAAALFASLFAALKFLLPRLLTLLPWLMRWRHSRNQTPPDAGAKPMDREQALAVLGLKERASREEILAAHRRLMQKIHPDRGGTQHLAGTLNRARDVLLG